MNDISRRRDDALTELYGRHRQRLRAIGTTRSRSYMDATAKDLGQWLMVWFMKTPRLMMFYRKFFSRFGERPGAIRQGRAGRSVG